MIETELYSVIYQDIQDALSELQLKTRDQHLFAIGLGMVEDLCGFFHVGCTLEDIAGFEDSSELWWISEWHHESTANNRVHYAIMALYNELSDDCTEEQYIELRQHYQNTIIKAVRNLRLAGKLKNEQGEEIMVILQYADAFDEDFEDVSFPLMNQEFLVPLFQNRFKKQKGLNLYDYLLEKYQLL